jgi:hypothetical protein
MPLNSLQQGDVQVVFCNFSTNLTKDIEFEVIFILKLIEKYNEFTKVP